MLPHSAVPHALIYLVPFGGRRVPTDGCMLHAEVDAAPLNAPEGAGFVFGGMAIIHAGHAFVHLLDPHKASRQSFHVLDGLHAQQVKGWRLLTFARLMPCTW